MSSSIWQGPVFLQPFKCDFLRSFIEQDHSAEPPVELKYSETPRHLEQKHVEGDLGNTLGLIQKGVRHLPGVIDQ